VRRRHARSQPPVLAQAPQADPGQADALRVRDGPGRLGPNAVRYQVPPDRHPVPRVRRGTAVPLPVGGDRLRRWRRPDMEERVWGRCVLRDPGLPRHPGHRLRVGVAKGGVPVALSGYLPDFLLTRLDYLANLARKHSLWPMPFATACCGIELMATAASRYDIARFG